MKPQSSAQGLLVAPMTYIGQFFPLSMTPSISLRNWFLTRISPPTSLEWRPRRESISSINTMEDSFAFAFSLVERKSLATFFSASPNHFDMIDAASTE